MLHQRRLRDVLQQFQNHMGRFRTSPQLLAEGAPAAARAAHAGWLARQYAVMAELLASRVDPSALTDQVKHTRPGASFEVQAFIVQSHLDKRILA